MRTLLDLRYERQLRPAKLTYGTDVPRPLFRRKVRFENDDILRPADHHGSVHRRGIVLIGEVELPHSANIARGEAADIRVCLLQVFRGSHRSALPRAFGNQPPNLTVRFRLRKTRGQNRV